MRKCVRVAAPVEPLESEKKSLLLISVFWGWGGREGGGEYCGKAVRRLVESCGCWKVGALAVAAGLSPGQNPPWGDCAAVTQTVGGWSRLMLLGVKVQSCDLNFDLL